MRITVGNAVLGDLDEDIYVGGFVASTSGETQRARAKCDGLTRLKDRGNGLASFDVPLKRSFETVSEAQKWIVDTAKAGGVEGRLLFAYADGTQSECEWAVARPSGLSHQGVMVSGNWRIEAGAKLL